MKKSRISLAIACLISSLIAFIYQLDFIFYLKNNGHHFIILLLLLYSVVLILFNTGAFMSWNEPNSEYKKHKWKSIVACIMHSIFFISLLSFYIIGEYNFFYKYISFSVLLISGLVIILYLIGINTKITDQKVSEDSK